MVELQMESTEHPKNQIGLPPTSQPEIAASLNRLLGFLGKHPLESFDPYDFKGSSKAEWLGRTRIGARGLHWMGVTAPILTRKLLRIKRGVTASGVAYAASGFLQLARKNKCEAYLNKAEEYITVLRGLRLENGGWGLPFAWQSAPTIRIPENVTLSYTTYTGLQALFDHFDLAGNKESLNLAVEIGHSALRELNWIVHEDSALVSYSKYDKYEVINTNSLLGSILIQIGNAAGDNKLYNTGITLLKFVKSQQNDDGSWCYFSKRTNTRTTIDNYHSAMTLRGLLSGLKVSGLEVERAIAKGTKHYFTMYLEGEFFPALWPRKKWPKDIACVAEGILFLNELANASSDITEQLSEQSGSCIVKATAQRLAIWAAREMQSSDGSFLQRKYPFWGVDTKSLRWGQGMMLAALSTFDFNR